MQPVILTAIVFSMLSVIVCNDEETCAKTFKNKVELHVLIAQRSNVIMCLNRTQTEVQEKHILALEGEFLIMCRAEEAIEFFFEGELISPLMNFVVIRTWPFNHQMLWMYGDFNQMNTGRYGCTLERDKNLNNSVYLYVQDTLPPYILNSKSTEDVYSEEDTIFFPCKSSNPNIAVNLYQLTNENPNSKRWEIFGNDVRYDRTKGFFVEYMSPHTQHENANLYKYFMCATDATNEDYKLFKLHPRKGGLLTPVTEKISIKYWEDLQLKCEFSKPQNLTWTFNGLLTNQSSFIVTNTEKPHLRLKYIKELFIRGWTLKNINAINVTCRSFSVAHDNKNTQYHVSFSHTWQIDIRSDGIHPDDLKLNLSNSKEPIICSSTLIRPELSLIPCKNRLQCDVRKICLLKDVCNTITTVFGNTHSIIPHSSWLLSPTDYGILLCSANGTQKIIQFYTGFNNVRYSINTPVPPTVLLQIENIEEKLYTQQYFNAACNGIEFVVSQEITWGFVYQNGTNVFLKRYQDFNDTVETVRVIRPYETQPVLRKSSIFIDSTDVIKLICMAPLINSSTEWINITMDIDVHESLPPKLNENKNFTFYIGDTNKNLTCSATGNPPPDITWKIYDDNKNDHQPLRSVRNEKGEVFLRFSTVSALDSGKYVCKAVNFRGSAMQIFTLNVKAKDAKVSGLYKWLSIGLGTGVTLVFVALITGLTIQFRALKESRKLLRSLTTAEVDEFKLGVDRSLFGGSGFANQDPSSLPYNVEFEIEKDQLEMKGKLLGSGAYGKVIQGKLTKDGTSKEVAIKTVSPKADVVYFKALLSELKIMTFIGTNPNIVSVEGAYTKEIKDRILYLVMEVCENGSLKKYLQDHRSEYIVDPTTSAPDDNNINVRGAPKAECMTFKNLCEWALQTAQGMDYLASKKIVHGDLAARNILLTNNLIVKITDFGLSKQLYEDTLYKKKKQVPLPWKWLSIEILKDMIFSTKSDVWAYGVTVWEIFSLGEVPYPGVSWTTKFLKDLVKGERLECPKYATKTIHDALLMTWDIEPSNRPDFKNMIKFFHDILNTEINEVFYVDVNDAVTK